MGQLQSEERRREDSVIYLRAPEAGSLADERKCDSAGFRAGRSDWRQALFCTTSRRHETTTRSNSHTIDYSYTRRRHVTSRKRTNQLLPFTHPIRSQSRNDNQYRFQSSTSTPGPVRSLVSSGSSTRSGTQSECKWPSACTSAPACQGTRRSSLHTSCHSCRPSPHTCVRSRSNRMCSWSKCERTTRWLSKVWWLVGKRLRLCWMCSLTTGSWSWKTKWLRKLKSWLCTVAASSKMSWSSFAKTWLLAGKRHLLYWRCSWMTNYLPSTTWSSVGKHHRLCWRCSRMESCLSPTVW